MFYINCNKTFYTYNGYVQDIETNQCNMFQAGFQALHLEGKIMLAILVH
jgi:hypothetical protein